MKISRCIVIRLGEHNSTRWVDDLDVIVHVLHFELNINRYITFLMAQMFSTYYKAMNILEDEHNALHECWLVRSILFDLDMTKLMLCKYCVILECHTLNASMRAYKNFLSHHM